MALALMLLLAGDAWAQRQATPSAAPAVRLDPLQQELLDAHNAERRAVGAPPLRWNPQLEAHAQAYARYLAQLGRLVHAPRDNRGIERDNLVEGLPGWTPSRMVQEWVREKRHFHPGTFPNVCNGDEWGCTHFTQMIWPTTTDVGCGVASGGGYQWLVCRYSPGGNRPGQAVGPVRRRR